MRGGYGVYYDQAALAPDEVLYFNAPYFDLNSVLPAAGAAAADARRIRSRRTYPLPLAGVGDGRFSAICGRRILQHWNVNVQRQLGTGARVEVAYVGSRGRKLIAARDINQPAPEHVRPTCGRIPFFADITASSRERVRPTTRLQLQVRAAPRSRCLGAAAYTLGQVRRRCVGILPERDGDANFPQDSNNPEAEWGRSNFDVRHRLSVGGLWQLPFGENATMAQRRACAASVSATGNCSGVLHAPERPAVHGGDSARASTTATPAAPVSASAPTTGRTSSGDPSVASDPTAERWFNTGAFAFPPFGHLRRRGPQHPRRPRLPEREPGVGRSALPSGAGSSAATAEASTCSTAPTSISRTTSWARRRSGRSCRRSARGGSSWGEGDLLEHEPRRRARLRSSSFGEVSP